MVDNLQRWISKDIPELVCLLSLQSRFGDSKRRLIGNYNRQVEEWKSGSGARGNVVSLLNEMNCALAILSQPDVVLLEYEPAPSTGKKTVDFKASLRNGEAIFIDVKTIRPDSKDENGKYWKQYCEALSKERFSDNTELKLWEEDLGGELYHVIKTCRTKMLVYALELEEKIKSYQINDNSSFSIIFCSNGHFGADLLEDFADFYLTGRHRVDDQFGKMEDHYIESKQVRLKRNISGFHYLKRTYYSPVYSEVFFNVRGRKFR